MTAGRTEKPRAPEGWQGPRKPAHGDSDTASEERAAQRSDIAEGDLERKGVEPPSVAGQASAPSGSASPRTGADTDVSVKALQRKKIGLGSYEDPADEKRRKGKPKKTGRPGR